MCNNRTALSDAHAVYGLVVKTLGAPSKTKNIVHKATCTIGSAHCKWQAAENLATAMENRLDIPTSWLPTDAEYMAVIAASSEWKYKMALDKLEHLVVQRLFELSKLNLIIIIVVFSNWVWVRDRSRSQTGCGNSGTPSI